jgi:rieske iron-sulfur protein
VDDWLADEQHVSCACHFSTFDPKDGGKVVDGPAPRELPALPLKIVDGKLVVAKPFTTPVGFEKG